MPNIFQKIRQRKLLSIVIGLAIIVAGYWGYKTIFPTNAQTLYVTAQVQKGTITTSVSGTGQVSASNQIDVKPNASGNILSIFVSDGQAVKAGQLIVQLDAKDAQKAVRDAQASLESVQIALQKLKAPTDALSLLQAQDALAQAQQTKQNSQDNLTKAYEDSFNNISNTFLDLPDIMSGMNDMLFSSTLGGGGEWNVDYYADVAKKYDETAVQLRDDVYTKFTQAKTAYDKNFNDYKAASRYSDQTTIDALISETYDTTKTIADMIKSTNNLIQFYHDQLTQHNIAPNSISNTHLTTLNTDTGKLNSDLLALLNTQSTIKSDQQAITNADQSIAEKTQSLQKLQAGADPLDIQSQELSITQKQNALVDAQQQLANYSVRAPFDGILSNIAVQKGDSISAATTIGTLTTSQQIAEISLNEVDAANVALGQKVTLTFDALPNLNLTGKIVQIDTIGTVSQGVVTYNVKIGLDSQDDRIKPGMSVTATIITQAKPDVLIVPNSAIKTSGDIHYVLTLDSTKTQQAASGQGVVSDVLPQQVQVEIGSSNDTSTEITSGLKEGDQVVTKTVTSSTTQSSSSSFNLFGLFGGNRNTSTSGTTKSSTTNSSTNSSRSSSGSSSGGEMGPPPGGF